MFQLMYADEKGRIFDHPEYTAGGRTGSLFTTLQEEETFPLPEGATLVSIPGGKPVGIDGKGNFTVVAQDGQGKPVTAVGALLPQGFTRTLLPAYRRQDSQPLPLFGYTAVGWKDGTIHVAALQTDEAVKWNPVYYSTPELPGLVEQKTRQYGANRIISQLAKCALQYNCFTAQNIFYGRWEGGVPVSPTCNANCLGCISQQPSECCPSPQNRIDFAPTAEEILEVALPHLVAADEGIISFGQGCEGEPSLAGTTVARAIERVRRETGAGTINMNTNAGHTDGIRAVAEAGIDSLRVSTISAREDTYVSYYAPRNYRWQDVCVSVSAARAQSVYVSLNLLTYPGLTDTAEEVSALVDFIRAKDINMVQLRNLNIDPDYLGIKVPMEGQDIIGIPGFIEILRDEIPGLTIGNYSRPVNR